MNQGNKQTWNFGGSKKLIFFLFLFKNKIFKKLKISPNTTFHRYVERRREK